MNEVFIDIRSDDELQEIFTSDFVSIEELRNKLVDLFYQVNREEDNFDSYMDQCLEEEYR
jgi:hypothetical protein